MPFRLRRLVGQPEPCANCDEQRDQCDHTGDAATRASRVRLRGSFAFCGNSIMVQPRWCTRLVARCGLTRFNFGRARPRQQLRQIRRLRLASRLILLDPDVGGILLHLGRPLVGARLAVADRGPRTIRPPAPEPSVADGWRPLVPGPGVAVVVGLLCASATAGMNAASDTSITMESRDMAGSSCNSACLTTPGLDLGSPAFAGRPGHATLMDAAAISHPGGLMFKSALLAAVTLSLALPVSAAEIKVISANGMREVIAETKAKFEEASGHRLTITVVETGEIRSRVLGGEQFDVIMVPSDVADEFEKAGQDGAGQRGAVDPRQLRAGGARRRAAARPSARRRP